MGVFIICDLCTEILIYDSYWEITSKDFLKLSVLQRVFSLMIIKTVHCPSYGGVSFIESFIIVNQILKRLVPAKSVRFMEVSVLWRCPSYRGVRQQRVDCLNKTLMFCSCLHFLKLFSMFMSTWNATLNEWQKTEMTFLGSLLKNVLIRKM